VRKILDYLYRGYWSDGGRCRIRIYHEDRRLTPRRWRRSLWGMEKPLRARRDFHR
jgi:hypothetical protein